MQPTDTAIVAVVPQESTKPIALVYPDGQDRTDDPSASNIADARTLRRAAALARMAAATLATVTAVTARTDGAATLQALRQAAGDCSGYAESMESEAAA